MSSPSLHKLGPCCHHSFQHTHIGVCFMFMSNQGRRNGGTIQGHCPPSTLKGGQRGHKCPYTSIISNLMIYQHQLETNLLQLFGHTWNSECFSIISVISFEVNILAKHVNAKTMTIMAMGVLLHRTPANSSELVVRQSYGRPQGH